MSGKYASILIDGNNMFYKSYKKLYHLTTTVDGQKIITGGIYGFIKSLLRLKREFLSEGGRFYILFDNCNSKDHQRKEVDPDYKIGRSHERSFYKSLELLQYVLMHYSDDITMIYRSNYEADDFVKPLLLDIPKTQNVLLVSEDRDWARMIEFEGRVIHWYAKRRVYDRAQYFLEFGYKPSEQTVVMEKTIRGDKSDNIPAGVPNIKGKTVIQLINQFDNVYDMVQEVDNCDYVSELMKDRIKENEARLRLNFQLVSFAGVSHEEMNSFTYQCRFDPKTLNIAYKSMGFDTSFDPRMKRFEKKKRKGFYQAPKLRRY